MLIRVLRLMRLLQGGRYTVEELADIFGCTTRTIRRDLNLLEEVHAPIVKVGSRFRCAGPVPFIDSERREVSA